MPARVTDVVKSVIFGIEAYKTTPLSTFGLECGRDAVGVASDAEALRLEKVADGIVSLVLLEA